VSGVARTAVVAIEAGRLGRITVGDLRAVITASGARLELRIQVAGGDVHRLLDAGHAALQDAVVRRLRALDWQAWPEVSFSIFGERGIIDILAWHGERRMLLVVEVKTLLVDFGDLLATMDRRLRLAPRIAVDRGLDPIDVGAWVAVRETATNRRRLSGHAALVRAAFPDDGRTLRAWLREPSRPLRALAFLSDVPHHDLSQGRAMPRRVRLDVQPRPGPGTDRGTARGDGAAGQDRASPPRVGVAFRS